MKDFLFALYAIKKNIQGSAELRTSFLLNLFGMALNDGAFLVIWIFFVRSVGVIGGWTAADIVGMLGFTCVSFGVVYSVFYGLQKIPDYSASGGFDRYLLSPKNLLLRVATSAFLTSAVGDVLFGTVCLIVYGFLIHISLIQSAILMAMVLAACVSFFSVVTVIYSMSFLFADPYAVTNSLFNLYIGPSTFHGGAFQGAMRFIFTFLVPCLLISGLPVEAVKNVSGPQIILIISLSAVWFLLSLLVFNKAVRKYESSNFMTFGN